MKIPSSIRQLHSEQYERNEALKGRVDDRLRPKCQAQRWHYESRLKSEVSVALKIESGRVANPAAIEDFFGCTIVVRDLSEIQVARDFVEQTFAVVYHRPKRPGFTHKSVESFPFDDLRLYVRWRDDSTLPPSGLTEVIFEIQVRTFLQHAWGIATHDLVYKTDSVDWGTQRIAFQVKAMLEHAEVSIQEAGQLSRANALAKDNRTTRDLKEAISMLKRVWVAEFLPQDVKRLAENALCLMELCGVKVSRLETLLDLEKKRHGGALPLNLSPYGAMVQALVRDDEDHLRIVLNDRCQRGKLVIGSETDVPQWMREPGVINVVLV